MKKTFKTFALMLLTAFALSSCVDVPAPFNLPDKSSSSDGGGSSSNEGTPVTCAQAVELTKQMLWLMAQLLLRFIPLLVTSLRLSVL